MARLLPHRRAGSVDNFIRATRSFLRCLSSAPSFSEWNQTRPGAVPTRPCYFLRAVRPFRGQQNPVIQPQENAEHAESPSPERQPRISQRIERPSLGGSVQGVRGCHFHGERLICLRCERSRISIRNTAVADERDGLVIGRGTHGTVCTAAKAGICPPARVAGGISPILETQPPSEAKSCLLLSLADRSNCLS